MTPEMVFPIKHFIYEWIKICMPTLASTLESRHHTDYPKL